MTVTGEVGAGKTTLCRAILHGLDQQTKVAFVQNPKVNDFELLQFVVAEFGIRGRFADKFGVLTALNQFLLREAQRGNNVVLIIDEAQNLTVDQLEQVRLLSNLETKKQKILQIVLSGQSELTAKLDLPELRQLKQRLIVKVDLQPLNLGEMLHYIKHRLKCASKRRWFSRQIEFTAEAIVEIYSQTRGIPRLVNSLCDRTLLAGYIAETHTINDALVRQSAAEVITA